MTVPVIHVKPSCIKSEIVRYLLAEKGADIRVVDVSSASGEDFSMKVRNGQTHTPAMAIDGLVLDDLDLIIEYIEDRHPSPAMMPATPAGKATTRVFFRRILHDLYPLLEKAETEECAASRESLRLNILSFAPVFGAKPFFMSDEIGILDILLAPPMYRLHRWNATMGAAIDKYTANIFCRTAFQMAIGKP